jgi:3-oxoacyl-[acyl-carrier protein] reductase
MCKTDAFDYAADGIRVNCVLATADIFLRPQSSQQLQQEEQPLGTTTGDRNREHGSLRLGRRGAPEDGGNLVTFLSSSRASWLTGLVIPLDGGLHLARL